MTGAPEAHTNAIVEAYGSLLRWLGTLQPNEPKQSQPAETVTP